MRLRIAVYRFHFSLPPTFYLKLPVSRYWPFTSSRGISTAQLGEALKGCTPGDLSLLTSMRDRAVILINSAIHLILLLLRLHESRSLGRRLLLPAQLGLEVRQIESGDAGEVEESKDKDDVECDIDPEETGVSPSLRPLHVDAEQELVSDLVTAVFAVLGSVRVGDVSESLSDVGTGVLNAGHARAVRRRENGQLLCRAADRDLMEDI